MIQRWVYDIDEETKKVDKACIEYRILKICCRKYTVEYIARNALQSRKFMKMNRKVLFRESKKISLESDKKIILSS